MVEDASHAPSHRDACRRPLSPCPPPHHPHPAMPHPLDPANAHASGPERGAPAPRPRLITTEAESTSTHPWFPGWCPSEPKISCNLLPHPCPTRPTYPLAPHRSHPPLSTALLEPAGVKTSRQQDAEAAAAAKAIDAAKAAHFALVADRALTLPPSPYPNLTQTLSLALTRTLSLSLSVPSWATSPSSARVRR